MVNSPRVVHRRLLWIMTAAVAVLIGPLAWYLGSPLFLNRTVDESAPSAGGAGAEARALLSSGSFGELDAIHKGEGQAVLFTLPDGQPALRFENFKVTNGPDLFVYLSGHPAPRDGKQLHESAALEIARLKGNVGNQNYALPADLDLARFKSVVIYCKQFSVVFSTAELRPEA
jgi:hypothetical protein